MANTFMYSFYFKQSFLGNGIFTTRGFRKGDLLLEYKGDLLTAEVADERRRKYEKEEKGCCIYDIEHQGRIIW